MSGRKNGRFAEGNPGRPAGSRNKLQADFVKALAEDFAEHGEGVVRIVRVEKPAEYLKIVAGVLPKEFLFTDNPLGGMSDEELEAALETVRAMRGERNDGESKKAAH